MSNFSVIRRSDFDNSGVTGTRDTIDMLQIGLRDDHLFIMHNLGNIVMSSTLNNILDLEPLDALIFWNSSSTVATNDYSRVTSILLISSIISSFFGHL